MNTTAHEEPIRELDSEWVRALVESLIHLTPASRHLIEVMKGVPPNVARRKPGQASEATPHHAAAAQFVALSPLVADHADGLTQVQIAKKHRLQVQTVRKRLIEAGVDTRARLRVLTDENLRTARAAINEGASAREIARGLGVAHTTVTRSLGRRDGVLRSPSRTTPEKPRVSAALPPAPRSPSRTRSKIALDQGKREVQTGPSMEMLGPVPG